CDGRCRVRHDPAGAPARGPGGGRSVGAGVGVAVTRTVVHLLRHGEVYNPDGILYGRLPGFGLSEQGQQQAKSVADTLATHDLAHVVASPLQRAQETARPVAERHAVESATDERLTAAGQ